MSLPRITDAFVCVDDCPVCLGSGHVCEDHPDKAWGDGDGCCGAPGMPCLHARCRFADSATIKYASSEHAATNRSSIVWACGLVVEIGPPRSVFLPELRALHRTALLSRLTG